MELHFSQNIWSFWLGFSTVTGRINPCKANILIIEKPPNLFTVKNNWMVSIQWKYWTYMGLAAFSKIYYMLHSWKELDLWSTHCYFSCDAIFNEAATAITLKRKKTKESLTRCHSFSTSAKFPGNLTFLTKQMLILFFRKSLHTY